MYNQKIATIFDHCRVGLENTFLENKSGRTFCVRQVYFTKSCQQIWGCAKPIFYTFYTSPLRWNSTTVFIMRTSDRMQYFTIFQDKLHSVNIQDDQSWAFSETVQKISKITYTASRFSLLTSAKFAVNITRVTLQHNKEFVLIFLFHWFITMCNLKKAFDTRSILSTPASDVYERLKTNGKLKLQD